MPSAALGPPQLKAIITLCAADDRYADDAHYMGGCLLNENLLWGTTLVAQAAWPPDPALVGGRWRAMWLERLRSIPLYPETWLSHPLRDGYWRHGSVCEDFAAIRCPIYAVSGWADGYSNAVGRLLAGLDCPRKGLIGPWAHVYPHQGVPGPAIGFLQEALRWWDRWLKGEENGIEDEPVLRAWLQEPAPAGELLPFAAADYTTARAGAGQRGFLEAWRWAERADSADSGFWVKKVRWVVAPDPLPRAARGRKEVGA